MELRCCFCHTKGGVTYTLSEVQAKTKGETAAGMKIKKGGVLHDDDDKEGKEEPEETDPEKRIVAVAAEVLKQRLDMGRLQRLKYGKFLSIHGLLPKVERIRAKAQHLVLPLDPILFGLKPRRRRGRTSRRRSWTS